MNSKKMSYTKLGIVSAIIFIVIVVLIEFLLSLNSKDSITEITNYMTTPKYILSKLIVGTVYGFLMVFLFKRKEKKIQKK